jgi:hypothetical protein
MGKMGFCVKAKSMVIFCGAVAKCLVASCAPILDSAKDCLLQAMPELSAAAAQPIDIADHPLREDVLAKAVQ